MSTIRFGGHVRASVAHAFEVAISLDATRACMPSIERVWDVRGDQSRLGDSYRFRDRLFGLALEGRSEVTDVERPVRYTATTEYRRGPRVTWTMRFVPAGHGTDVRNEVTYQLGDGRLAHAVDGIALRPLMTRRLRDTHLRYRELVESRSGPRSPVPGAEGATVDQGRTGKP